MVKSSVTFFGSNKDSLAGLKRSLIPFFSILILSLLFILTFGQFTTFTVMAAVVFSLIVCSCVGIQDISSSRNSGIWGLLIGWVLAATYLCLKVINESKLDVSKADLSVLIGLPVATGLVSYINSFILKRSKFYRSSR